MKRFGWFYLFLVILSQGAFQNAAIARDGCGKCGKGVSLADYSEVGTHAWALDAPASTRMYSATPAPLRRSAQTAGGFMHVANQREDRYARMHDLVVDDLRRALATARQNNSPRPVSTLGPREMAEVREYLAPDIPDHINGYMLKALVRYYGHIPGIPAEKTSALDLLGRLPDHVASEGFFLLGTIALENGASREALDMYTKGSDRGDHLPSIGMMMGLLVHGDGKAMRSSMTPENAERMIKEKARSSRLSQRSVDQIMETIDFVGEMARPGVEKRKAAEAAGNRQIAAYIELVNEMFPPIREAPATISSGSQRRVVVAYSDSTNAWIEWANDFVAHDTARLNAVINHSNRLFEDKLVSPDLSRSIISAIDSARARKDSINAQIRSALRDHDRIVGEFNRRVESRR